VGAVWGGCADDSGESMERGFSEHYEFDDRLPPAADVAIEGDES